MSTEDDRPGSTGGYSTSSSGGLFTPGGSGGSTSKIPHDMTGADEAFGQYDFTQGATQVIKAPGLSNDVDADDDYDPFDDPRRREPPAWHGGADLGLLVLRVTLAVLFVAHGVQHLFGWLNGPGIGGTEKMLAGFGFDQTTLLAWLNGVSEILGGVLIGLGLFTPAGAAAILGVMACAIAVKADVNLFAAGAELEIVYAAAAFTVLFAGPGRISLDRHTPWYRKAPTFGVIFLVIALGAAAGVYYGLR
ncbi:DoxX family protein [Labedaea rhizosphaerae]|nr:DoxX family protein [Labedaea rhizosphaerae]